MIKNKIFTALGFGSFALLMVLFLPCFAVLSYFPAGQKWGLRLYRVWGKYSLFMAGVPTKVIWKGKERLAKGQNAVIVANHSSFLDIPVLGSGPMLTTFLGKHELTKVPIFGYIYRRFSIVVKRGSMSSAKQAIAMCKEVVNKGQNVAIFPEGTITKNPPMMGTFKDGAFIVAIDTQVPLVPVSMPYSWKILPRDKASVHVHESLMIIHDPIPTKGLTHDDIPRLKEEIKALLAADLKAYNKEVYSSKEA